MSVCIVCISRTVGSPSKNILNSDMKKSLIYPILGPNLMICLVSRQYLYAMTVTPLTKMDTAELIKQPGDVTECPYTPSRVLAQPDQVCLLPFSVISFHLFTEYHEK